MILIHEYLLWCGGGVIALMFVLLYWTLGQRDIYLKKAESWENYYHLADQYRGRMEGRYKRECDANISLLKHVRFLWKQNAIYETSKKRAAALKGLKK